MPQAQNSANLANTIGSISQGSDTLPTEKDVNFYDYDGTLLYSYTAAEAAELSALPTLPSHNGLICQCWNHTIQDVRTYSNRLNVGCNYVTSDGATRLYISACSKTPIPEFPIILAVTEHSSATIDWGDGTVDTVTNTDHIAQSISTYHTFPVVDSDTVFCIRISGNYEFYQGSSNIFGDRVIPLTKVEIGSGVTAIKSYTFRNCYNLKTITLSAGLTTMGNYTFENCYNLRSASIPDGVTNPGGHTFRKCYSLRSIIMPASVTTIGAYAFSGCASLSSVVIPYNVSVIGTRAFETCTSLTSVIIPTYLGSIQTMFIGCTSLSSVVIMPNGLATLGGDTFSTCTALMSVVIPDGVSSVGAAFYNCISLYSVIIPDSVTVIGGSVVDGCTNLRIIDLSGYTGTPLPTLGGILGNNLPNDFVILVASEAKKTELSAMTNWSAYASQIQVKGASL